MTLPAKSVNLASYLKVNATATKTHRLQARTAKETERVGERQRGRKREEES